MANSPGEDQGPNHHGTAFMRKFGVVFGMALLTGYLMYTGIVLARAMLGLEEPPPQSLVQCVTLGVVSMILGYLVWRDT